MRIKSKLFGNFKEKTYFCREFPKDRRYDDQPSAEIIVSCDDAFGFITAICTDSSV